jgi:hypothetical protein
MRLVNTRTLELVTFSPQETPEYVILSHRWGLEEVTFKDMTIYPSSDINSPTRKLKGFLKIEGACKTAASANYEWIWIDSCCIDKESSMDVDRSVKSMWNIYKDSDICFVYLADVPNYVAGCGPSFKESNWFTRGWTLQELIAPVYVEFYASDWSQIGTKLERYQEIAEITMVDVDLIAQKRSIDSYTTAERFSWAAHRQTTQAEDEAYSLLGLFQVHMPLHYGEGRTRAFTRLQETLYLSMCDDSIFLYRFSPHRQDCQPLLADGVTRFCQRAQCERCQMPLQGTQCFPDQISYDIVDASIFWPTQPHEQLFTTINSFRNEMSVPLSVLNYVDVSRELLFFDGLMKRTDVTHVAVLNHTTTNYKEGAFCLLLHRASNSTEPSFFRLSYMPALLPNVGTLASKMQKRKVLIPGPLIQQDIHKLETMFTVSGRSYQAVFWRAKNVKAWKILQPQPQPHSAIEHENPALKICTLVSKSKRQPEVSCQIMNTEGSNGGSAFLVELQRIVGDSRWLITQVFEAPGKSHKRQRKRHSLFLSKIPADRCTITLSDRTQLYIGLRRSAINDSQNCCLISQQQRYQIFVSSVRENPHLNL